MLKIRTTVYLDKDIHKEFKMLCLKRGTSVSEMIENFIKNELKIGGIKNGK